MPESACVYFSLGSNLGDRLANLRLACEGLDQHLGLLKTSSLYETEPWGFSDQPAFYNIAARAETALDPEELLDLIKRLEKDLGRRPSFRYGPRKIDIDILFYGDLVYQSARLEIPHPRLTERAFVLAPLAELAPRLIHPALGLAVADLLAKIDVKSVKFVQPFSIHPRPVREGKNRGIDMNREIFSAELEAIGPSDSKTCVRIPFSVEHVFARVGRVAVTGTLNGVPFKSTLEMEGNGTHTMLLDDATLRAAQVKAGDTVKFDLQISD